MKRKVRNNFNYLSHYTYYVPGVADMFILLVWFLIGVLLGNLATVIFTAILGQSAALDYGMIVAYPLMFIPAMMYASHKSRTGAFTKNGLLVDSSHFGGHGFVCALLAAAATFCMAFCSDALTSLMPQMPQWLEEALKSMTTGNIWLNFLMVSIFAPIFEEWLCRGMILRGLIGNNVKPVWAIVISSFIFAAIHANPWQAIPAFLLGCLFGYVYYKTGSLRLTMLMHFTNNTVALLLSRIPGLEEAESWKDVFRGSDYWILFAGFILLLILIIRYFSRIPKECASGNCDSAPCLFDE
ncbi:MAG: CPBP family intramembrane metalloprotease [Bacteroidales bacterium]|nr:CPBP family intramembrane metalloprotease [Bacteroidales bacterium]